jgi:phenylacetate-CoA ligase
MTEYFDQLEIRTQEQRERELFVALTAQLAHAQAQAPAYQTLLADIDPMAVVDRAALAHVPVTRKSDIAAQQAAAPPFGGFAVLANGELGHVFASPGGIFEPGVGGDDHWQMGRALHALGVRPGDLVHNTFSYHFTPAGLMLDSAFRAFGCAVFPAGVGQTELQVQAIAHFKPRVYSGTPSFLKIIFDKAGEMGADVSSLELGAVGGDALPNSLREELSDNGVGVLQFYGTADVGLIAFESEAKEGMILDESVIVEIVRPGTGDPVTEGEVGEVLVTTLNPYYPLIRFATGDLSAFMSGNSPCGRTNQRIKGWMGRADQTSKVRGMFVHPSQVADVVARHHEIIRARLVIDSLDNQDSMTLRCEVSDTEIDLEQAVSKTIREVCKVRGEVEIVGKGTLPNDGLVIDDQRSYD